MANTKDLLTPSAYAEKYKITRVWVSRLIKDKKIKTISVGGYGNIKGAKMIIDK